MGAIMKGKVWCGAALLCCAVSCGGMSAEHSQRQHGVEPGPSAGGTTPAGSEAPTTTEAMPLTSWPWFLDTPGSDLTRTLNAVDGVLTLKDLPADVQHAQLQTHNHFDMLADRSALLLTASASRETTVIAAFTGLQFENDYWSDLASGTPWVAAPFTVGPEPRAVELPFEGFAPQGPGTPRPMGESTGSVIWFLLEDAGELELKLADIRLQ